jgi:hypothetical protein
MINDNKFYTIVVAITILLGGCIGWGIISNNNRTEAIKLALEKGQNPLYVKCSMNTTTTEECQSMIMAMSLSGQFKDASAPISVSPASSPKK